MTWVQSLLLPRIVDTERDSEGGGLRLHIPHGVRLIHSASASTHHGLRSKQNIAIEEKFSIAHGTVDTPEELIHIMKSGSTTICETEIAPAVVKNRCSVSEDSSE